MEKKKLSVNTAATKVLNGFKNGFYFIGAVLFVIGFIIFLTDISWMDEVGTWTGLMGGGICLALYALFLSVLAPIVSAAEVYIAEKEETYDIEEEDKQKTKKSGVTYSNS